MPNLHRAQSIKRPTPMLLRPVVAAVQLSWLTASSMAAPQGGAVAMGQATIAQQGGTTRITQASQRAILNWQSFNVGANEAVVFSQPGPSAAILNRVLGNDVSQILGRISANGQVYLVNSNGIVFGRTARVDVGSLLATTSNVADGDFVAGRLRFTEPGRPNAVVRNEGQITVAQGGFAALVAPGAANAGVINARLGKVSLAAGDAFVLDLYGDSLVNLIVDAASMGTLTTAQGQPLSAFVDHSGTITADGGRIQLAAATVKRMVDNMINVSGTVRATTVDEHAGVISLRGDDATRVTVSGSLTADGARGGRVELSGREVILQAPSHLNASGHEGGGSIAIGGDWQGQGPLAHAKEVGIDHGARIEASAIERGDGGTVAVWSDERTRFEGGIAARGGMTGGHGGSAEVSSKGKIGFFGGIDVEAPSGRQGSLLLDPTDLAIGATTSGDSSIAAAQIGFLLSRGVNLRLEASRNLNVNRPIDGRGGIAGASLDLTAGNDLTVNGAIVLNDGALRLTASHGLLSTTGNVTLHAGAGSVALQGGAGVSVNQLMGSGDIWIGSERGAVTIARPVTGPDSGPAASLTVDAAGTVQLAGAITGRGGMSISSRSGDVVSVDAASTGGLVSEGRVSMRASGGRAGTQAAPVNVLAGSEGIDIEGTSGVHAQALVTRGTVTLASSAGPVQVSSAIGGHAGGAVAAGEPAEGVLVAAAGDVRLAGASAGPGGVVVRGYQPASVASSFDLSGASIASTGPVEIQTSGAIRIADGATIVAGGNVGLTSTLGTITLGPASDALDASGIRATTTGSGVTLDAHGDIALNADIQAQAGKIALTSANGAVAARVVQAGGPLAVSDAALDAGVDPDRSHIVVRAPGQITLGEMRAQSLIDVESTASNVLLLKTLGGSGTGYRNFADGYQAQERPNVGRLLVNAPLGSVELNGLNLDGNALPTALDDGLRVTAGRYVLSNETIAVNKGHILLRGGTGQPNHGVYLGSSVFSRGWDSVGADGLRGTTDDVKLGYRIDIQGATLGLFDNTTEFASLPGIHAVTLTGGAVVHTDMQGFLVDATGQHINPLQRVHANDSELRVVAVDGTGNFANPTDVTLGRGACSIVAGVCPVLGVPIFRNVAKIEIANNVANYRDASPAGGLAPEALQSLLVPSTNDPAANTITISTDTLAGVQGVGPTGDVAGAGRISLFDFDDPIRSPMSQVPVATTASAGALASQRGIALKLLSFEVPGDHSTVVWSTNLNFGLVSLTPEGLPPVGGVGGSNHFFNDDVSTLGVPLNGLFQVRVPAQVRREFTRDGVAQVQVFGPEQTVFTLRQLPGQLSAYAQVIRAVPDSEVLHQMITSNAPPEGSGVDNVGPWTFSPNSSVLSAVNAYTSIRFLGAIVIGRPGTASAIAVASALFPDTVGTGGTPLQTNAVLRSPSITRLQLPMLNQAASGKVDTSGLGSGDHGTGFNLGGAVADSSASGAFGEGQRGTRVLAFDAVIDTQAGRANGDSAGGFWLPGFGGVTGTNNSTTGLPSVGPGFGAMLGASGNVGVARGTPNLPPATSTTGPGERANQDAATAPPSANTPAAEGGVVIGGRPASMADLGRSGAGAGAAANVFKQQFRLATSSDSALCEEALQPSSQRSHDAEARDCKAK